MAVKKADELNENSTENLIYGVEPYAESAKEEYMNENHIAHFRNILESWRNSLFVEVSKTINVMQDEYENLPDLNDRASQETDMSLELRSRDRERKLLKKINSTLLRLDADDYGWCERCGVEIGIRLEEIKEKQMN